MFFRILSWFTRLVVDRISEAHRSWNMSRIGGKDTKPELHVRQLLHAMGYRFRLHRKDLPGKPDIVLPKFKAVIFVHGCYWHRHPGCKFAYIPKSRVEFWKEKFASNVARDQRNQAELTKIDWRYLVVWECEADNTGELIQRVQEFLTTR